VSSHGDNREEMGTYDQDLLRQKEIKMSLNSETEPHARVKDTINAGFHFCACAKKNMICVSAGTLVVIDGVTQLRCVRSGRTLPPENTLKCTMTRFIQPSR